MAYPVQLSKLQQYSVHYKSSITTSQYNCVDYLERKVEYQHQDGEGNVPEDVPGEVGQPVDSAVHPAHQLQVLDVL